MSNTLATGHAPEAAELYPLLTVHEAAAILRVGRTFLYNLMARGDLSYVRLGRARRLRHSDLMGLVRRNLVGSHNAA
jgi:excisionase family DNA binding protein